MKVTVSEKGQVTIPKRLRDRMGIRAGQTLDIEEEGGKLVAQKVISEDALDAVYGILRGQLESDDTDELLDLWRGPRPD
jgi:AbrB family looped-hinge helix DNA binding protein